MPVDVAVAVSLAAQAAALQMLDFAVAHPRQIGNHHIAGRLEHSAQLCQAQFRSGGPDHRSALRSADEARFSAQLSGKEVRVNLAIAVGRQWASCRAVVV